ncbi:predicted protein, partial [Nematostella vectensis]
IGTCVSNSCTNGGTCVDLPNEFKCVCPSGYEGRRCEHDINECNSASSPCAQQCTNTEGSFTCSCNPGY